MKRKWPTSLFLSFLGILYCRNENYFLVWELEERVVSWIYVTQTTPSNLIQLLSYPRVFRVLHKNCDENLNNA